MMIRERGGVVFASVVVVVVAVVCVNFRLSFVVCRRRRSFRSQGPVDYPRVSRE